MPDRICFVIAPIGDPETETRKRSDQVLKHIIRPVVEAKGYKAIRADEIAEPGIITGQVIQHIINDPLVIADLTDRNPNVFYELALRHTLRKPLVQIIQKDQTIPFDVAGMRTILVDHRDLDSAAEAKVEMAKQVEAVEKPNAEIQSPISVAVDLQSLRQSDNPEQRSLGDILTGMAAMQSAITNIQKQLEENRKSASLRTGLTGFEQELRSALHAPAGSGKTALAMKIVEDYFRRVLQELDKEEKLQSRTPKDEEE
jgi:hypothetical protein